MKTEIITISPTDNIEKQLILAASVIKNGGLVIFPTETVYGLGGDALNSCASKKNIRGKGKTSG